MRKTEGEFGGMDSERVEPPSPLFTSRLNSAAGAGLLLAYGAVLAATNPAFTFKDDEIQIIVNANYPIKYTVGLFAKGVGQHEHPPLFDLLLHLWLRLTHSRMDMLRWPSILFYLAGIWMIALTARKTAGWRCFWLSIAIGALWPFGFQIGRLAGWYSFCFFLVALVTHNYLSLADDPSTIRWLKLGLSCVALMYTNYLAWPLLACLAFDYSLLKRSNSALGWKPPRILGSSLALGFLPLVPAFLAEFKQGILSHLSYGSMDGVTLFSLVHDVTTTFVTSVFSLFVGEAVGLWFWLLSVPVMMAILVCICLVLLRSSNQMRRIFFYGLLVLGAMSVLDLSGDIPRVFFIAPWFLLPISVTSRTDQNSCASAALLSTLVIIAVAGWFGIRYSNFSAQWGLIVPWGQVTKDLAHDLERGDAIVTGDPRFFFYLNYELGFAQQGSYNPYLGMETYLSKNAHAYYIGSGMQPTGYDGPEKVIAVGRWPYRPEPDHWLNAGCKLQNVRFSIPDGLYELKKRNYPPTKQQPHPFQIVEYTCSSRQ